MPAAVASKVLTWKLFSEEDDELAADEVAASEIPLDKALLIGIEPKVSCTRASMASWAAAGSVGHIAYPAIAVSTIHAESLPFASCL